MILEFTVLFLLLLVVVFDIKTLAVPSMFTSGIILILAIINFSSLAYGIIAFAFAWFLYDADFFEGIGDVKVLTIIGLMLHSLFGVIAMMITVVVLGFAYKAGGYIRGKEQIAFTIPLFMTYAALWIGGLI